MDKTKILNALIERGYYLAKADSTRARLLDFIDLIRPVNVGIPLIRVGSAHDGGYLLPDDLDNLTALLSPGVGDNSDFEFFFAEKGLRCYLADYSVEGPAREHENFTFLKKFIGTESRGSEYISLDSLVSVALSNISNLAEEQSKQGVARGADWVLSLDIEGAEFETLLEASDDCLDRFRIVVMELHGLQRIFHEPLLVLYRAMMVKMLRHFHICHIHPSNAFPSIIRHGVDVPVNLEITFIHRSRVSSTIFPKASLPHPLDTKVVPKNIDLVLSDLWCKQ